MSRGPRTEGREHPRDRAASSEAVSSAGPTSGREVKHQEREEKRAAGTLKGQRARGWTEKLLTRTTSGAIYAIAILVCLYLGPIATGLLVAMMSWLCCSEFFRMMRMCGRMPNEVIGLAAAVVFPLAALINPLLIMVAGFVLMFSCALWYIAIPRSSISDVAVTVFGPLYTGLLLTSIVFIRVADPGSTGALLTFLVMGSIWLNDAFAYLFGSRFGRHKLAPRISPNKSWEGVIGGVIGSFVAWGLIATFSVMNVGWPLAIVATFLTAASGVVGDLVESRIKRGSGVKDSGNFMPGHGGLLDRSDSLLFGCMMAYFVLRIGGIL